MSESEAVDRPSAPTPVAVGAQSVVFMVRNAQQHHVQLSAMADLKANIIITATSVMMTFALTQLGDDDLRASMVTLSLFSLAALALGVLAVLPQYKPETFEGVALPDYFNLLFFGHFSQLSQERHVAEMEKLVNEGGEEAVFAAGVKDLYQLGAYLQQHKFRYLRYSYLFFLSGLIAAGAIQIIVSIA